ncbi:hypothetical protein AAIB48_00215 (plasmid) [Paraclostridium benzoelyticum]|uniref:hypothetical protein n=1 Tax=Paraclostridium benzoelyticum TaxID=1629550 RepID=UPI0031CCFD04
MSKYTDQQIEDTLKIIKSTIINCEKIQPKFKEGSPQLSLSRNRIKALSISQSLITNQNNDYTQDELLKAVTQITSIISKSKKLCLIQKKEQEHILV